MNGADDLQVDESTSEDEVEVDNFDDILAGIDGLTEDEAAESEDEENFDDILAGIEGMTSEEELPPSDITNNDTSESTSSSNNSSMDESKYPMPIEKEHKVVNQLNEVAEDSEQKASQIFDVLSFVLDENSEVDKYNKQMAEFIDKQIELLDSLSSKFPNVAIFKENLEIANSLVDVSKELSNKVNSENNKIFEAMELMQYHDINRQKIERVMAVIRKLSDYLNGIFEDNSDKPEVQIAKHIPGDDGSTVDADDLEALINQYSE